MGFGKDMKGKSSHEALIRIQDTELRLLDTLQHFISLRVDNDKKYSIGLGRMLNANKCEGSEFKESCSIFKAWEVIVQETENLMKLMKSNADHLQTNTLDVLSQLINEKKQAKKKYLDERNRLDTDFSKVQDEVSKNKAEYSKCVERLNTDKAKFLDMQSKGRPGPKLDELKSKFFRSTVQLHKQHNDYIVSLNLAQEHQNMLRDTVLPAVLDCHQDGQETFVHKVKFILEDYLKHTDLCNADFQSCTENIRQAIRAIRAGAEYSGTFIDLYKSSLSPPMDFTFDEKLLESYSGSLRPADIELNDLTAEALNEKHARMTKEMKEIKDKIFIINSEQQSLSLTVNNLSASLGEGCSIDKVNNYITTKSHSENFIRDILEMEGNFRKLEKLAMLIQQPLDQLGSDPAPPAADINNIAEPDSGSGGSQVSVPVRDANFVKNLAGKMNPFKKTSNPGNGHSMSSADDDATDNKPPPPVRRKPPYEKPAPFLNAQNGPPPLSMRARRERGQMVDMDASEAKTRIEDEIWFHGILPREEVQRLLNYDGDFLVRESKNKKTNESQFVLSVFWEGPRHFIIQFSADRGWHLEGEAYPTIQEMIQRFYESQRPITVKSGAVLKTPVEREWELLNDDIELKNKIGSGNFGDVFKGLYKRKEEVAVKTCKETLTEDQKLKFLQEGRILKQYNHPNIVRYIGIAAQKQPVMIVMEYITKGSLHSFLKAHGISHSPKQKVQMCIDAASGMEYLESRGCIHRDLAARNCLVGENNIIKISDFGMSREEQVYTVVSGNSQVPIKWTAPEALNFAQYTSLCDVWSYGVLMWEIFSCGKTPYTGMTNNRARDWVEEGHRLEAPSGTPSAVYSLMMKCWEYKPENRPHFSSALKTLQDVLKKL